VCTNMVLEKKKEGEILHSLHFQIIVLMITLIIQKKGGLRIHQTNCIPI
jgi:hypothetical protein